MRNLKEGERNRSRDRRTGWKKRKGDGRRGRKRVKYTVGARGRGSTKGKCRVGAQNTI